MSESRLHCSVYRSPKKDGMYLYVPKQNSFDKVPPELLQTFGTPGHVMDLELTPERKLARVNAVDVINGVTQQGFYLQMPPQTHGTH